MSIYFNIRITLPMSGTFLLGHPVYGESTAYSNCEGTGKVTGVYRAVEV